MVRSLSWRMVLSKADELIGDGELFPDGEAERFGCLGIDHKIEVGPLPDRESPELASRFQHGRQGFRDADQPNGVPAG
jgi:hypothetical protein